jgi:hypothetical protein
MAMPQEEDVPWQTFYIYLGRQGTTGAVGADC